MNDPSISVIIPTFNRAYCLTRSIESVLNQTHTKIDIWVIDDGSTDSTASLLKPFLKTIHYVRTDNKGVSHARNLGVKCSNSPWVAFLDSDDCWRPEKLQRQLQQSKADGTLVSHTEEEWIRKGIKVPVLKKYRKTSGDLFKRSLDHCSISPSSILMHRSIFDRIGLFDESLPACEDYDLWLKLTAVFKVSLVDDALTIKHGGHSDQLSRQFWGMDRFRIQAMDSLLQSSLLSEQQRKWTLETLQKKSTVLINGAIKHQNTSLVAAITKLLERHEID